MSIFGFDVAYGPDYSADMFRLVRSEEPEYRRGLNQDTLSAAAYAMGATPADVPGLWNLPGHPELTSNQLIGLACRNAPYNPR